MTTEKATPRPWKYGIGNEADSIFDANGAKVCKVYHNLSDRFIIVKAVNLFDELVGAVELLAKQFRCVEPLYSKDLILIKKAEDLVAKAKETP